MNKHAIHIHFNKKRDLNNYSQNLLPCQNQNKTVSIKNIFIEI